MDEIKIIILCVAIIVFVIASIIFRRKDNYDDDTMESVENGLQRAEEGQREEAGTIERIESREREESGRIEELESLESDDSERLERMQRIFDEVGRENKV